MSSFGERTYTISLPPTSVFFPKMWSASVFPARSRRITRLPRESHSVTLSSSGSTTPNFSWSFLSFERMTSFLSPRIRPAVRARRFSASAG